MVRIDGLTGYHKSDNIIGCAMNVHKRLGYLEAYKIKKGLLMNFDALSLEVKILFQARMNSNPDHP